MSPPTKLLLPVRQKVFPEVPAAQLVQAAAIVLILLQLVLRAWAIYGGWFYADDLKLLSEAATQPLTLDYLFTRHQQQLMPGGLLVSWLVGHGPAYSWWIAATTIFAMQVLANAACLLMLTRLFGWRPGILAPLSLYLFAPLTLGGYMWWAAALNQLPLQIAFFGLITTHVAHVRTARRRWAVASIAILLGGLLFYVKAVVVLPVVFVVTLAYFVDGPPATRVVPVLRRFWPIWIGYAVVSVGYMVAYLNTGGSPVGRTNSAYLRTADTQIRQTLGPALVGGPWRWLDEGRQDVLAHAPAVSIALAWIAITAVVLATSWRLTGAWRAWVILAVYLVPTLYLTAAGRSVHFGPDAGLFIRYLSDVAVVAALVLALATMPVRGSRKPVLRSFGVPIRPVASLGAVIFLVGSVFSTITYVRFWHADSPAEHYVAAASADLALAPRGLEIVDQPLDQSLSLQFTAPFNRPSRLLVPLHKDLRPVSAGTDLRMFGTDGRLGRAVVTPGTSADVHKNADCGLLIIGPTTSVVRLKKRVNHDTRWMKIGYLGSGDGQVRVVAGSTTRVLPVERGLHMLLIRTTGSYDSVSIESTTSSLGVCVDDITVGFIGTFS